VLQLYVWLRNPEQAGTYALASIGISALTTGFSSAMIAFDMDVDVRNRRKQPKFYGYIPDDNAKREWCFRLLILIGTLHNICRSLGCALFFARDGKFGVAVVGVEMAVYLLYKLARGDFKAAVLVEGLWSILGSLFYRVIVKIVADFTGCIHFRHPKEIGGLAFSIR